MDNYDTKGLLASKAVWGGIIALVAGIAGIFGYTLDAGAQEQLSAAIVSVASAIGGILAIYGRVKASKVIK